MRQKLRRLKEDFLKECEGLRGYSAHSILNYNLSIDQMIDESEIHEDDGTIIINLMPLRLKIARLKPKSISAKLSAIRSFIKYSQSVKQTIILNGDESIKVPKTLPKPISHEHIMEALSSADSMERLLIIMLYTMGLRISELANLKISDITESWCRVLGKGSRERDVPMIPEVYDLLREREELFPSKGYVFELKGEKLSENSLRYTLTKVFSKHGLKVTPHQLRHAYATELLNHGARIADVSELLGHKSMATTQIYTKLGNAIKMENYLQSHPLCKKSKGSEC